MSNIKPRTAPLPLALAASVVSRISRLDPVYRVTDTGDYRCGFRVHGGWPCGSQASAPQHTPESECFAVGGCDVPDEHHEFTMVGGTFVLEVEMK